MEDLQELINEESFNLDLSKYSEKDLQKVATKIREIEKENPFWEFEFTLKIEPQPAPRPRGRIIWSGGKPTVSVYDPKPNDKKEIKEAVQKLLPENFQVIDGETYVNLELYKPMLKNFNKTEKFLAEAKYLRPDKKPDADNYAKTVLDGVNEVIWTDDGRVVQLNIDKYYSTSPRIEVKLQYREKRISTK